MPLSAYVVDCGVYVDGKRLDGRFTHDQAIDEVRRRGEGFVWIGLHEPTDEQITAIAETYGLHELAVEDAVTAKQRPKLERYETRCSWCSRPSPTSSTTSRPPPPS